MGEQLCSVVIPAHDEAAGITDVLSRLAPLGDDLEIIVVANGCTDATAELARAAAPNCEVVELEIGSKPGALNEGDRRATVFPRLYLDGDIRIQPEEIEAMIDALSQEGVIAVGSTPVHDLSNSSWVVRSAYRIITEMTTNRVGLGGANPQMLSRQARERFGEWPDVIGDDYFLDGLFDEREAVRSPAVESVRVAPTGFLDCVSRKARIQAGNTAVIDAGLRAPHSGGGLGEAVRVVRRRPALAIHLPAHVSIAVAGRLLHRWRRFRGRDGVFYRDSSRA